MVIGHDNRGGGEEIPSLIEKRRQLFGETFEVRSQIERAHRPWSNLRLEPHQRSRKIGPSQGAGAESTSRSKSRSRSNLLRSAPYPGHAVLPTGDGEAAVAREGHAPHLVAVAFEFADLFAVQHIPQAYGVIGAGGEGAAAIGRKR